MADNKVQIIIEAYDKTKAAFGDLEKSLKGVEGSAKRFSDTAAEGAKRANAGIDGLVGGIKGLAGVFGVGLGVSFLIDAAKMGAAAKQAEESFRALASGAGESADDIISAMTRATNSTIDDSDLMQKAIKGMALGMSGSDMVKISEMARQTARVTGASIGETFERLSDSISTNMPRALKQMGLITKEQMKVVEEALSKGVEGVDLLTIAYANFQTQQNKLGPLVENESEKIQQQNARWTELKETIGQTLVGVVLGLVHPIDTITESLKKQNDVLEESIDDMGRLAAAYRKIQDEPETFGVVRQKIEGKAPKEYTEEKQYGRYIISGADKEIRNIKDQIDAVEKLKKANEEAAKEQAKFQAEIAKLQEEAQKSLGLEFPNMGKRLEEELDRANKELDKFFSDVEKLSQAAQKSIEEPVVNMADRMEQALEDPDKFFGPMVDKAKDTNEEMKTAVTGWAKDFSGTLNDVLWGSDLTFGSIAKSFAKMITQMTIQAKIIEPLMKKMFEGGGEGGGMDWGGLIKKGIGAFAGVAGGGGDFSGAEMNAMSWLSKGGVFNQQGLVPFASGGLVVRPTIFPFAGGVGLMGEKGAEAIMPLSRTASGDLGVKALGGGGITVNVHNNAGAEVATSSPDGKTLDILIERKMLDTMRKNPGAVAEAWNSEASGGNRGIMNTLRRLG